MGKKEKVKGRAFEYRIVNLAKRMGFQAKRVVLSGSTEEEKGDVEVEGITFECRYRTNRFLTLRKWMKKALSQNLAGLILGGNREDPLIVLPLKDFFTTLRALKEIFNFCVVLCVCLMKKQEDEVCDSEKLGEVKR